MSFSNYEIHVKGKKRAVLMLYAITRSKFAQAIIKESGTENDYILYFTGTCLSADDLYGFEQKNVAIDTTLVVEEDIRNGYKFNDYVHLSLRQKSELLGLEILARTWSQFDNYDQLEHYRNGYFVGVIGGQFDPNYVPEYKF